MTARHRFLLGAIAPLLVLGVAACGTHEEPVAEARSAPSIEAAVAPATVRDLASSFEAGGVVRARTTASLLSRIVAEVREVRVQPGDRVRRGQVLVALDDRDLSAARSRADAATAAAAEGTSAARADQDAAEAAAVLARTTYERISTLRAKNSATPQELDQAVAARAGADARLRGATARVAEAAAAVDAARATSRAADVTASFALITAPFDGIVTNKLAEPGNMASPGAPLLTIDETGGFRLDVQVDESRVPLIGLGAPVSVELDAASAIAAPQQHPASFAGRIVEIARAVDPSARAFLVKIDLPPSAPVRSGMFGRARFAGPIRQALTVPARSVVRRGQLTLVFVVDAGGRARMRAVSLGASSGDVVEVLAGLDQGERVIVGPPPSITDGAVIHLARGGS